MFQVFVQMAKVGDPHEDFASAFRKFHEEVNKIVAEGTSRQVLETMCFIQYVFVVQGKEFNTAMGLYDCCDLADKIGLLIEDGTLQEYDLKEYSIEDVQNTFIRNAAMEISAMMEMMVDIRAATA